MSDNVVIALYYFVFNNVIVDLHYLTTTITRFPLIFNFD